ncbi:type I restriction enzyme HsdR N-terminal domain-containing protein [Croceitalea rosinachiae]|uniref:Type I restriction enzyme HsdR N-terminal domain-containing protein n=1 Tax=Croceitalea rosinachiae TaxID=3075596 RepID=A0ABU3AFN8_9FLAO|nr:type I restriction enzyme HsdR N-terminal domain-containing protein [Croceitalea sp. F388]MDT0607696.1 type I restriction enzyme HsdR N-terminal domain-containing protein [Croceitalea sp. F388]
MQALNFPTYHFRLKNTENSTYIFDVIRKKFVVLQPEEWVRQHVLCFLMETKGYPKSLINVEKQIIINGLRKRYDIIIFNKYGEIDILIECKAPDVDITQKAFDQIAIYNLKVNAKYIMVSNGINHYYCQINHEEEKYTFLKEIPDFNR